MTIAVYLNEPDRYRLWQVARLQGWTTAARDLAIACPHRRGLDPRPCACHPNATTPR